MAEIAIYHPFIDLADSRLLRTCVLYWDEIRTIVPESMGDPYDSPASKEAFEAGVLRPRYVSPDAPEVIQTGEEFLADAERSAIRGSANDAVKKLRLHRDKLPQLHPGKLSEKVRQTLFATDTVDADGFLRVTAGFGSAYMSRLATVIGEANGTIPLTDSQSSHKVVVDRYVEEWETPSIHEAESKLAKLSIQAIQIHRDTPLHDVLTFREKHRDELERYRRAIRKLAREAGAIRDRTQFERELGRIVNHEIQPSLEELKRKIKEQRLAFGLTALDMTQACLVGVAASGFGGVPLGTLGAVVSLTIAAYKTRRGIREAQRDNPLGYLLSATRDLAGASP